MNTEETKRLRDALSTIDGGKLEVITAVEALSQAVDTLDAGAFAAEEILAPYEAKHARRRRAPRRGGAKRKGRPKPRQRRRGRGTPPVITDPPIGLELVMGWTPRDGDLIEGRFPIGDSNVSTEILDGVEFRVYSQKAGELDAQMVTFAAINGHSGRGCAYFTDLSVDLPGAIGEPLNLTGKHVILPRGAIIRRYWIGPDAKKASEWGWIDDPRPVPEWADSEADRALMKPPGISVGPYDFLWKFKSLSNSHGGQGVGPFHGGPDDWLTCPEGRQLREREMLLEMQRPIWLLGDLPDEPYWMGRTMQHRLSGYNDDPDEWCPYAHKLNQIRPADHTHLRRETGAPFALAPWDTFAKDCALNSFRDFQAANRLDKDDDGSYHLLDALPVKIADTDGHLNSEGDRGLAHWLCLLRWSRPYVDPFILGQYEDLYREWVRKMAHPTHGYTRSTTPIHGSASGLVAPYGYVFHDQLVLEELQKFGGLDDVAERLANFLTSDPPKFYESRDGGPRDTVHDFNTLGTGPAPYAAMTHGVLLEYDTPEDLLHDMEFRGVNGSSQDLDSVPRSVWEAGL